MLVGKGTAVPMYGKICGQTMKGFKMYSYNLKNSHKTKRQPVYKVIKTGVMCSLSLFLLLTLEGRLREPLRRISVLIVPGQYDIEADVA